jgi:carbamate kinase
MQPKIEAIIQFLENGGKQAIITSPENLLRAVKGEAGTTITK